MREARESEIDSGSTRSSAAKVSCGGTWSLDWNRFGNLTPKASKLLSKSLTGTTCQTEIFSCFSRG